MFSNTLFFKNVKTTLQTCLFRQLSQNSNVISSLSNGVKEIVMCNSKARNALSISMMNDLLDQIRADQHSQDLRVIVISGQGPAFSAGHNLKELANDQDKQTECFNTAFQLMNAIIDCPVPVIAKVDGIAAAAGCQLVAQCDLAISSERSTFSTPGANFGIFCSTPGVALARCIHKTAALYMLLTGNSISAEEAYRMGLVTRLCSSDDLDIEVEMVCNSIKMKSREVIELGKKFFYEQIHYDIRKAYQKGGEKMVENLQMPDCKEGIQSFIEKRKPQWGKSSE